MFMGTGQLLTGLERPKPLVASTVLCAVSVIGLGIIGCKYMGVAGVALAMAASKLLTFWPIQFLAARKIFLTEHAVPEFVPNEEVA
jgi:O-antigen/teichoic acid export membrane protein